MPSEYKSPMSRAYRKPIIIRDDDPRVKNSKNLKRYRGKIGSEVIVKKPKIDPAYLEESYEFWTLNGASVWDTDYIKLSNAGAGDCGTAWYSKKYTLPFKVKFNYQVITGGGIGIYGDGISFMITDYDTPSNFLGFGGGSMGIFTAPQEYNIFGIAFDSFTNGIQPSAPFVGAFNTKNYLVYDGQHYPNYLSYHSLNPSNDLVNVNTCKIEVSKVSIKVYINSVLRYSTTDLAGLLPNKDIKIGFAGSNGQATATWKIKPL